MWMCIVLFYLGGVWSPEGGWEGEEQRKEKEKWGKTKRKDDKGMDAQVLLLMDPGAELGWAELSDTLPSGGREREYNCQKHSSSQK